MPRKRLHSNDPLFKFRNMLEAQGLPAQAGRARLGAAGRGRSAGVTPSAIVSPAPVAMVTQNGQATITDPNTYVDVTHGLAVTPDRGAVSVTPANNLGSASAWWLSDFTATTFRINLDAAPGVGTPAVLDWHAHEVAAPPATSGYADEVLADSPLGYWRLGELAGGTAANEVVGEDPLTHLGSVTLAQPGAISDGDYCIQYPGTATNRSECSNPGLGASDVTLEAWAYITPPQKGVILYVGSATTRGYGFGVGTTTTDAAGSNLIGLYEGVRWIATGVSMSAGWHHIVMTILSGTARMYLDGVLVHTSSGAAPGAPTLGDKVLVGGYAGAAARWFSGRIDEPAVYASALDATRIAAHYAAA